MACVLVLGLAACGGDRDEKADDPSAAAPVRRSDGRRYLVSLEPQSRPIPVGPPHDWNLAVRLGNGGELSAGEIAIDGGLPAEGRALPRLPRVSRSADSGAWLVRGVQFDEEGEWVLRVEIDSEAGPDTAHFPVHVGR